MNAQKQARGGFTLIELLVVMSLIAVLAALMIAFFPNAASSAREARAATQLQGWLNIAKQRALRDQAPRGLRLWVAQPINAPGGLANVVTDCQYIEQPDDYPSSVSTQIQSAVPPPPGPPPGYSNANCIFFSGGDLVNGVSPSTMLPNSADPNAKYWTVQPGDYLEIYGSGLMYRIDQVGVPMVNNPTAGIPSFVKVSPPLANPINSLTANYRILRAPRPVGDELLKLPDNTIIDLNTNLGNVDATGLVTLNPPPPNLINNGVTNNQNPLPPSDPMNVGIGYVDILFSPTGTVISRGISTDKIHLWVRAPAENDPGHVFRGAPTLVSIFVQTGFTAAFPPNPNTAGNPYTLVK